MHRIRAGVLSYVLTISILISTGLTMLSLYVYYTRVEYIGLSRKTRMDKNLQLATRLTEKQSDYFEYNKLYAFDLFGRQMDSVSIYRTHWGIFDRYTVSAFSGSSESGMDYLLGYERTKEGKSAVYLVDDGRPLAVVGDTKITGDSYLPLAGIQSAYINRLGYTNKELIYGEELKSEKDLPKIDLENLFRDLKRIETVPAEDSDSLNNSFENETAELTFSGESTTGVYMGNIIITSNDELVFDSLSRTEDIIAIAPVIRFEPGFTGSGQFFATDTIMIHEDVELKYPTVLAVYNRNKPAAIQTSGACAISGWLIMDGGKNDFRQRLIYLEDGTKVEGMVFCNGMLEHYGAIAGHATVKRFLVNSYSGVYENYILNAIIDSSVLDSSFVASPLWFASDQGKVLKYLN